MWGQPWATFFTCIFQPTRRLFAIHLKTRFFVGYKCNVYSFWRCWSISLLCMVLYYIVMTLLYMEFYISLQYIFLYYKWVQHECWWYFSSNNLIVFLMIFRFSVSWPSPGWGTGDVYPHASWHRHCSHSSLCAGVTAEWQLSTGTCTRHQHCTCCQSIQLS